MSRYLLSKIHRGIDWYFSKSASPYWIILLLDCLMVVFAGVVSYYIVYGGHIVAANFWEMMLLYSLFLPCYLIGFRLFHTYAGIVRYTTNSDLIRVVMALAVGTIGALALHKVLVYYPHLFNVKARTILLQFPIGSCLCMGLRLLAKVLYDTVVIGGTRQKVFIYGVHEGGEALAHSIMTDKDKVYYLAGFVTDDQKYVGHRMMGVKVYMNDENLVDVMKDLGAEILFVSPLKNERLRKDHSMLLEMVRNDIKVMIRTSDKEWDGKSPLDKQQLHKVQVEDLLAREQIEIDMQAIGEMLKGKCVMITGAAGSIGFEMAKQVAAFGPSKLVLVDQAETPLHDVRRHMADKCPYVKVQTIVCSIANEGKMEHLFAENRPHYVFHAAAYKHVPMMEDNPSEAVQNNIYGTRVIANLAVKYGTRKFVMISTDKAVNPTNVMGCSKRICEIYCQSLNQAIQELHKGNKRDAQQYPMLYQKDGTEGVTQFVTTRFGNVLGSNGSVIPIFRKQIAEGGPVTVTHPDIIRYFMLISEACRLVLEAGTIGHGGEIFVFDMGEPVRIADMAQKMIDLSGAKGVKIKYTGLRDGEKLYEEVLNNKETSRPTPHPKIMVSAVREYPFEQALKAEKELYELSFTHDAMAIVKKMKEIVPEYKSNSSVYEVLDK
jgi:FlaA1/EpsC-like NDP-sugar epimerase